MCVSPYVQDPLFLSDFLNLNYVDRLSKNTQISNFMKIPPVMADMFHEDGRIDGQTDITKLFVTFLNFANKPKD